MQNQKDCTCSMSSRAFDCQATSHIAYPVINQESERKLKPRLFAKSPQQHSDTAELSDESDNSEDYVPHRLTVKDIRKARHMNDRLTDEVNLMTKNRNSLEKFEALSINGKTLTDISIGGFEVDLQKAAEKTLEILPLPPSRLPVIFRDEELNFYHHFFQGMTQLIGECQVELITSSTQHEFDDDFILYPVIESMIATGYEKSDTESMLLLKKVFTSTFEMPENNRYKIANPRLNVVANLWGFQYIEPSMQMYESDLKVWFSLCYNHYKTLWFNAFKMTGIPAFVTNKRRNSRSSSSSSSAMPVLLEDDNELDRMSTSKSIGHRSKRRSSSSSVRSVRSRMPDDQSLQLTRFLSGRRN